MIVLNNTTESIVAVMAVAPAANQPVANSAFADTPSAVSVAGQTSLLTGVTLATIVAAPPSAHQRAIRSVSVYNADTANVTLTIYKSVSGTLYPLAGATLLPGQTISMVDGVWRIGDTGGLASAVIWGGIGGLLSSQTDLQAALNAKAGVGIPQNAKSAAYTLALTDNGQHIYHPATDTTARIWTIPSNSAIAFPIGAAVTFINENAAGVITLAITTDTLRLSPGGTTGSRSLAANGMATAIKVTATSWKISGSGLT